MSAPHSTRQWILTNPPTDFPHLDGSSPTWTMQTNPLPTLKDDQVLLRVLYLSNDPAQRGWIGKDINPERLYTAPVYPGDVMRAGAVAKVLESKSPKLPKGKLCMATTGWTEYAVLDAEECKPLEELPGLSPTHYLGAFGLTGLTAYYGIKEIVRVGPGDTVVVSGAAGATGSMVVQIAKKMLGCKRVIGMAGSDDKCRWVESLGADVCLNYKKPDFQQQLINATDGYVEVYYDNVGGKILDLMLMRMKQGGRIAACGAIEDYNTSDPTGLKNWYNVITMRLEIRGLIIFDFLAQGKGPAALKELTGAFKEGKIKIGDESETVVDTRFEDIPKTWFKLFDGGNTGKLVTKLV